MATLRSALYLDFDNVFGGLLRLDPSAAMSFARSPRGWLDRLASEDDRKWLVLRCYLNPNGAATHPRQGHRVGFAQFRRAFTDAGFEVVDCPRLASTKNGGDIRLVVDALDALRAEAHYDEFVIASGDSDMTPLLVRLRAGDRRVGLISPSDSAVVMRAVADRWIGGDELLELVDAQAEVIDDDLEGGAGEASPLPADSPHLDAEQAEQRFAAIVRASYAGASEPLVLSSVAHDVVVEIGASAKGTSWFGHGSFARAVRSLDLDGARFTQHHLWNVGRHRQPQIDPAVARIFSELKIPLLPAESWPHIYSGLSEFARGHEFSLTEATRWTRDQLSARGIRVNRSAVGLVARGASYAGVPLYAEPSPTATQIGDAFVTNLLARTLATDNPPTRDEELAVRRWFGALD